MAEPYVILPVNPGTYKEIKDKLLAADYGHAVHTGILEPKERVVMHGIAIAPVEVGPNPATQLHDFIVNAGFPLTDECEQWFRKMEDYCDQIVKGDITTGEQEALPLD